MYVVLCIWYMFLLSTSLTLYELHGGVNTKQLKKQITQRDFRDVKSEFLGSQFAYKYIGLFTSKVVES